MVYLTVRETAVKLTKSEETIKRRLRAGLFPNAYKRNDKEGWRIPESDLHDIIAHSSFNQQLCYEKSEYKQSTEEIVDLAYRIAMLAEPSKDEVTLLSVLDLKHALEILLIMRQSPKPVKNPLGFIKRAIKEGWSPITQPKKIDRKRQNLEERLKFHSYSPSTPFPFYNWLEDDES
ncbi:helix-turn-helix domain-containing protein [Aneurinibacillus sp. Ricciae_BoGa-3]|uniref:helix-turn-helix domain-containing protein n=1 Tax=Aneurinibacillus sp. Ricciae_BoGa-3 TaxID=3022697 RepID=UPI00234220AA|nr:helix-turn-helix domain-containing protein [Aneurinibacillus sp. Ricciae_BoGa-3]WCK55913.1 helix-turn-helix domain-containing protein [Aneurinibacillus sp. Ricciae_BoGa-3]